MRARQTQPRGQRRLHLFEWAGRKWPSFLFLAGSAAVQLVGSVLPICQLLLIKCHIQLATAIFSFPRQKKKDTVPHKYSLDSGQEQYRAIILQARVVQVLLLQLNPTC